MEKSHNICGTQRLLIRTINSIDIITVEKCRFDIYRFITTKNKSNCDSIISILLRCSYVELNQLLLLFAGYLTYTLDELLKRN